MHEIPCPLEQAARRFGCQPAIISGEKVISYEQYYPMAASVGLGLEQQGIHCGQRVGIVANTCWQYVVLLQALFRLGAVACPMSPRFPEKAVVGILERIQCKTVIDTLGRLSPGGSPHIRRIGLNDAFLCWPATNQACGEGPSVQADLDAHATIVLTSGTSGLPKAALHSYGNHYYSALGSNENIPVEPGDRWLLSLPLYHVGGLGIMFRMLLGGGTVVIPEKEEDMGLLVDQYGITHVSLVSTQLYRWLGEGVNPKVTARLKAVLVGGGPVPASLVGVGFEAGFPLFTTYGSTEMTSQITTTAPGDGRDRLLTCGKVLEYRSVKIDGEEILVKGRTLFKGYVEAEGTVLPVDNKGWYRTGDLGRLDDNGYLFFLGRKDNMFISGGENITPEEIERQLCLLPKIGEAVVVPVKDREFGFRPVAFVKMSGTRDINEVVLAADLEQCLPRFKIPVAFHEWPEGADKKGVKPDRQYLTQLAEALKKRCVM